MSKKKEIRWLYDELPDLVSGGVLSGEVAEKIKEHYGPVGKVNKVKTAVVICSVFGALLIGLGMVLVFGHNWDQLSRLSKTIIAFLPLLGAQALAGWALLKKRDAAHWCEGTSTFLMISVGLAMAIIGQAYHIPGNMSDLLFWWMIVSIPIMYLFRTTVPAVLYMIGITWWACEAQIQGGHALVFWPLFGAIMPYFFQNARENQYSGRVTTLAWMMCLSLSVALGVCLEKVVPGLWIIIYSSFYVLLYLVDGLWFDKGLTARQRPFRIFGVAGASLIAYLFTYQWPWDEIGISYYRNSYRFHEYAALGDYVLAIGIPLMTFGLLWLSSKKGKQILMDIGVFPIIVILGYLFSNIDSSFCFLTVCALNVYVFYLSIRTMVIGIRNGRLGVVNLGMLLLVMLLVARFFDVDMSFVVRGVIFIIIGCGFLVTNVMLMKRKEVA